MSRVAIAPLATLGYGGRPVITRPEWPALVQDGSNRDAPDVRFMASVARQEEQGSDVNVASHPLIDTLTGTIDAAVVINNGSDLAYPIACARERLPVGLVNPTKGHRGGKLAGLPHEGAGNHWWYQL